MIITLEDKAYEYLLSLGYSDEDLVGVDVVEMANDVYLAREADIEKELLTYA